MTKYVDSSINPSAINECLAKFTDIRCEVHTLSVYHDNKKVFEFAPEPYSMSDAAEVYSMSKTFAATVAGIAWDMELFSLDDKIIDIFPEECPENISDNLAAMTVKNVISMNTGHEACVMPHMRHAEDSVKAFLSREVPYKPGTHFAYNTGATCLIAAMVEKLSGKKFFDFACEKLFYPMGITNVYWNQCDDGICEGGIGLHISNEDISKLGLLYYNGGVHNGKRIVSREWIDIATSAISDNSNNGDINWCVGYGCQIWRNNIDGYRADGAFGQFCVVLPKFKSVITATVMSMDTAQELHILIDMAQKLYSGEKCDFEGFDYEPLANSGDCTHMTGTYILDENLCGFKTANISVVDGNLNLTYSDSRSCQNIVAGNGRWIKSTYCAKSKMPKLLGLMSDLFAENITVASSYTVEDNKIIIESRYLNSPHSEKTVIETEGGRIKISFFATPGNDGLVSVSEITGKSI